MADYFEQEKNKKASVYTIVTIAAIVFVLFMISWQLPQVSEPLLDQGIEVNLGNSETGLGDIPPTMPGEPAPKQAEMTPATPKASPPPEEPITTNDENDEPDAPVIPKTKPNTTPKAKPKVNNNVATAKPVKAQPAPPAPKPKAVLGAYKGGNGNGGNNQDQFNNVRNQGVSGGNGDQGKANGNINSDNYKGNGGNGKNGVVVSRGLTGRRITKLPSFEDDFNENAKIAVDIKINENGNVISASYTGKGSTSGNQKLKAIALRKAFQLKFSADDSESSGTVVFNFRLKG